MIGRLSFIAVCVSVILTINSIEAGTISNGQQTPEARQIHFAKDIREFARNHPDLILVRMTKEPGKARSESVRYTLGNRVSGDRLVAQNSDVFAYPARKDVTYQLTYPEEGVGSIVTRVEIVCTQDNTDGNAYVVAGGIGERFISIVIEANQTENFTYSAQYYGVS